jgi:hypothetical protein
MASCAPTGAIGDLGIIYPQRERPGWASSTLGRIAPCPWDTNHDRTNTDLPKLPNRDQVDGIAGGTAH